MSGQEWPTHEEVAQVLDFDDFPSGVALELIQAQVAAREKAAAEKACETARGEVERLRARLDQATVFTLLPDTSPYPPHEDIHTWGIRVEQRGPGSWAVVERSWCLDRDGHREYESMPSERTDEFKTRFRFTLDDAFDIAERALPNIRINGATAVEAAAWVAARQARDPRA